MDLKSGAPWWPVVDGLPASFPPLAADVSCDVAVIGAGITGALLAWHLADADLDVAVLDKRDAGNGSTSASTALLQFELDVEMQALARDYGEAAAALAYRSCAEAIDELAALVRRFDDDCGFRFQSSLYYASRRSDVKRLREEGELRRRHGLRSAFLDRAEVGTRFDIDVHGALLSEPAGSVDPYRLTYSLLGALRKRGVPVFDRTKVEAVDTSERGIAGSLVLRTDREVCVRARWVVVAAGYESEMFLKERVARNRSSYAFVSEPLDTLPPLMDGQIAWETARPYLYMRTTQDRRILLGGEDDAIDIPARRDKRVGKKIAALQRKWRKLMPDLALEPAFAWAGTFAETEDGLPWFGAHPQHDPRILFAMAYGGNGIAYSMAGRDIILDAIKGKSASARARLFGFDRPASLKSG